MKLLILVIPLVIGSIILFPKQKDISGTWILDNTGKKFETTILHIQMAEGYYTGKLDIPDQELYDQPVGIRLNKDRVKILLDEKGNCFIEGKISDSSLTGNVVVDGKPQPVRFTKNY